MNLFEEIYDGELCFEIADYTVEADFITMDLVAEYEGKEVGFQVRMPVQTKKMLFKSMILPDTSRGMEFISSGERSDRFIAALDTIWTPDFEVEGKFEANVVELDYSILNKELFECTKDKTYTRLYAEIDMETGDPFDNINTEILFNFNLSRKRASLIEGKRALRNDFLAMIMA